MGERRRRGRGTWNQGETKREPLVAPILVIFRFVCHQRPRKESNLHPRFRKPMFYPLNYGDLGDP